MSHFASAVILAAGKGIRLDRPSSPKPLVHIGHKPLLLWTIERLQESGVKKIWIVSGTHTDIYRKELSGKPSITAEIVYLGTETGAGDMLQSILSLPETIEGPYILTVSDIISEKNPYTLLAEAGSMMNGEMRSVVGMNANLFDRCGAHQRVRVEDGLLRDVGNTLSNYNGLEIGVYGVQGNGGVFFRDAIANQPTIASFEQMIARLAEQSRVRACPLTEGEWYDVNTPGTAVRAEMFVRAKFYPTPVGTTPYATGVEPTVDSFFARNKKLEAKIMIKRGLLDELGRLALIAPHRYTSPHILLTDVNVNALYGERVLNAFRQAGYQMIKIVMPSGEQAKSLENYAELTDMILSHGMDEGSVIVDIGGGVVNNMAGFLAATLYRGLELIHIPTTTMSQVDAAIDFKQAVNSKKGKNLTGAYHPASFVLIDPDTLRTLPERHLRDGLAESIKHALTQDETFLQMFLTNEQPITDSDFLETVIRRTIALKVPLLNAESQTGVNEMAPQYGHCVGHAIEHLSGYEFLHGEAVAIGMCISAEIARIIGACDNATVETHYTVFSRHGLPTTIPKTITVEDVLNTIRYDKHYLGRLPRMGLVERVGHLWADRDDVSIPIDYPLLAKAIEINQRRETFLPRS